jgi:anti-sigma regulatory factor (Ser/Thr protein kinase)
MIQARRFSADPRSVSGARRFAIEALAGSPADVLQAVELMVSELATNCVRHVHSGFELKVVRTGDEIRVEVTDGGGGAPKMQSPTPEQPSGRGLRIVDMLSERWGVTRAAVSGKTVWFAMADSSALKPPTPSRCAAHAG